jgi:hypothetical protein
VLSIEEVKEIVMTSVFNSAEMASMNNKYLLYVVLMKPGKDVLLVAQNLPVEMYRFQ